MVTSRKKQICELLKGIETGDPTVVSVVNEDKYIQHNPQTHEGSEGLVVLFKRLSKTSPKVNIVRIFEDGDFVFAYTKYDFATRNIGFEIFRFENDQAVEHWDNIQKRQGPNIAGHTMVDGATDVTDHNMTENNRKVIKSFVENVLIQGYLDKIDGYINQENYTEHNPRFGDDLVGLRGNRSKSSTGDSISVNYKKRHRLLAEGDFDLFVCEGYADLKPFSYFDLYRLKAGKIEEHWDTTEVIPLKNLWKNNNGKF